MTPAGGAVLTFLATWIVGTLVLESVGIEFRGLGAVTFFFGFLLGAIVYRLLGGQPPEQPGV